MHESNKGNEHPLDDDYVCSDVRNVYALLILGYLLFEKVLDRT